MSHTRKPEHIARGKIRQAKYGRQWWETTVRFDLDTASEIKDYATHNKISFGEAIRRIVENGIETMRLDGEKI